MQWFPAMCHAGPSSLVFFFRDVEFSQMVIYKACIDRSDSLIFQHKCRPRVIGFTYAFSEVHFRSTESQTFYQSIMTADDSIKCRCANSGMTVQVGGFQNPRVCLQVFPSFLPHPLPALLLAPFFARSLTLVPCSLLLNHTETLATQARQKMIPLPQLPIKPVHLWKLTVLSFTATFDI